MGVLTDRDLRHHLFEPRVLKGIGAVSVDSLLREVRVEGGVVVGIITETDLLRRICRADECSPECAEIVVSFP